eukprot:6280529-Pyramimonas_sp.AAC.1
MEPQWPPKAPVAPPACVPPSRGPIRSSTEGPSGAARMRRPPPSTAFRGPVGRSTEKPQPHRRH